MTLFPETPPNSVPLTRTDYLKKVFGSEWSLGSQDNAVTYFPQSFEEGFSLGYFARRRTEDHHDGPETGFAPKSVDFWEKAAVVLNLDPTQQVVGIEFNDSVGSPKALLRKLVEIVNWTSPDAEFKIDSFPLHQEKNFYAAVAKFPGKITSIEFNYVVPNVFGGSDEVREALEKFKRGVKARTVKAIFNNPDGLDPEDEVVKDGVAYVAKGGGDVKAKSGMIEVYNSEKKAEVTVNVDAESRHEIENGSSIPAKIKTTLRR